MLPEVTATIRSTYNVNEEHLHFLTLKSGLVGATYLVPDSSSIV